MNQERFEENRRRCTALLRKFHETARAEGVPDDSGRFREVSAGDLIRRKREKRLVRAYAVQMHRFMMDRVKECRCAFLLFDEEGCLLRIKGTDETLEWLEKKGIRVGTIWELKRIGPNAVTIGLEMGNSLSSVGDENYQKSLKDAAIYYSSLSLEELGKITKLGGVAIMIPAQYQDEAYMLNAACMASGLNVRIRMAWRTSASYTADTRGMVLLDINDATDSVTFTHHNEKLFDILKLPRENRRDVYFRPAVEYFDPLPMNRRFWEIISGLEAVTDYEISLYVRGKRMDCVISTEPETQADLDSRSVLLYITTKKQISKEIAKETANNAIISFDGIIGKSAKMKAAIHRAKLLAGTDSNIMILGESGVGKDVFAQAIHNQSRRRDKPFIAVNCGALPRDLIASELFGYDGGAFTGAKKKGNIGKFELADGGTLFLDEIGELPLDLQATLLRIVEQKQFMRLGSNKLIHIDVKIISATNADILKMIEEKKFRADLFYRLGAMQLFIPPLRERGDDPVVLADFFIQKISERIGRTGRVVLSDEAVEFLKRCPWTGNVRELQNMMECIVQLYEEDVITLDIIRENMNLNYFSYVQPEAGDMPEAVFEGGVRGTVGIAGGVGAVGGAGIAGGVGAVGGAGIAGGVGAVGGAGIAGDVGTVGGAGIAGGVGAAGTAGPVGYTGADGERKAPITAEHIRQALDACGGNRSRAAKYLGISRRTLYRYMDRLGMSHENDR